MSVLKIKQNGEWVAVGTGAEGKRGKTGNGIVSMELVSGNHAPGTYDTYRITFTDGETADIQVYNGANGEGAGDMLISVYDPQGKYTDIFAYIDEQVAKIPTPDVSGQISSHNTNTAAHNDIRDLITGLTNRLNALANSDDTTLDQMAEVVAYIKDNRELIEQVTTGKVNVSDIINNLTTNVSNKPLSAAQGVVLKGLIDTLSGTLASHTGNTTMHITAAERSAWNAKSDFSGNYNDLSNKPSIPTVPADVGAAPSSHDQAASTITSGTFAGQVVANSSGQAHNAFVLRNSKLVSADDSPTVNGEICWTYK